MSPLSAVLAHASISAVSTAFAVVALLLALLQFSGSSRIHNHCYAVQNDGWWVDQRALVWQPAGCTLHKYTASDLRTCLAPSGDAASAVISEQIVFIGDSTMRNKYYALARLINPDYMAAVNDTKAHSDLSVGWPAIGGPVARFIWDPYLTTPQTHAILSPPSNITSASLRAPKVVVVGSGAWFLRNAEDVGGLQAWRRTIDWLADRLHAAGHIEHAYVSPVPGVVPELLTPERRRTLKPPAIDTMNDYMAAIDLPVFSAWALMAQGAPHETLDGLHYSPALNDRAVALLLNRVCNPAVVSRGARPPLHTTCCFAYPSPGWYTRAAAALTAAAVPLMLLLRRLSKRSVARALPSADTVRQMAVFGAVLLLMYTCDRTPLFAKLHKHFDARVFALLCSLALAAGVAGWEEDPASGAGFLGRRQTDEWKGWMQIAILVYHLLNASTVSAIYNPVRVLVAMYLFMTGYGHCSFFYTKGDYGLRRLTAVLLRTNVLAVGLAYMMGTSYMDYYFAPLSSAWVLVVWATMRVASSRNKDAGWVVWAKLAASAWLMWLVNTLHLWPFGMLERVFGVRWSQREWEFRFGVDIFIVYVGMAVALVRLRHGSQLQAHARWPQMQRWAVVAALAAIAWYFWFELTRADKYAYNAWHAYVSPLAVLGFVVLRNATPYLRAHSSSVFRYAGVISLELFIAQFHLFLAADTKAVLVLVHPRLWFVNLAVVTLVFVGMCKMLATASGAISAWLMATPPPPPESSARLGAGSDIAMAELGHGGDDASLTARPALDRLASEPPVVLRVIRLFYRLVLHSLAVRWVVGIAVLLAINKHYDD
ncbi:hypothetical protein IW150_000621 [Coemansia sp. RSA 2607]|nr:hypothetical protein IW150_000621 [Coemansia sp. RSA 2607]